MTYAVEFTPAARRALNSVPEAVLAAVIEFVRGPLAENPHRVGKQLREPLADLFSARRGDYRVLYEIHEDRVVVVVVRVDHRRTVYRT